jgi:DNA-binding PadR family transcriptional regulator
MAHADGPDTERAAAKKLLKRETLSAKQDRLLRALREIGEEGATGTALTAKMQELTGEKDIAHATYRSRLSELSQRGLIRDTTRRTLNKRNNPEVVWTITEAGLERLKKLEAVT